MRIPALTLALLAAGCADAGPEPVEPPDLATDSCNAAAYRSYVGEPQGALDDLVIPDPKRIIPEGAPVTMDYNPVRLNFDLDAAGNIARIWCG